MKNVHEMDGYKPSEECSAMRGDGLTLTERIRKEYKAGVKRMKATTKNRGLSIYFRSLVIVLIFSGIAASAGDLTANDIIAKANLASYYAGDDGRARVKMEIVDDKGGVRTREFVLLRKNTGGGNQKFYVYFEAPADVRRMAYLVWKEADQARDDDRWFWLPALNLVRRIAPGDKRTSFVGSDFVYEDVSGRHIKADEHTLVEEGEIHYKIKSIPRDSAGVEFSYYHVWIDKETFLPKKAEYYDRQGTLYRRVTADRIEVIQDFPTVLEATVHDLKTGGYTKNTFSEVEYNIGLKEVIFSERFLRRPPREVMQ